jgi:hypothetical protein
VLARCTADEFELTSPSISPRHTSSTTLSAPPPSAICSTTGPADEDFSWMRERLFADHDLLMLFNPALDGIANANRREPLAASPGTWFTPFRGGFRLVSSRRSIDEGNVRVSDTDACSSIAPAVRDARPSLRVRLRVGHGDLEGNDGERSHSDRATLGGRLGSSGRRSRTALDNPSFQPWHADLPQPPNPEERCVQPSMAPEVSA